MSLEALLRVVIAVIGRPTNTCHCSIAASHGAMLQRHASLFEGRVVADTPTGLTHHLGDVRQMSSCTSKLIYAGAIRS